MDENTKKKVIIKGEKYVLSILFLKTKILKEIIFLFY